MITDKEFERRISAIDKEQKEENLPIYSRALNAFSRYAQKYKMKVFLAGFDKYKTINKYDSTNVANEINKWYEKKYGDALKVDFTLGNIAIQIAGDIYRLTIPLFFCGILIHANGKDIHSDKLPEKGLRLINVLKYVEKLTQDLASELSHDDEQYIVQTFNIALELFNLLNKQENKNVLCKSARADFGYAVESLLGIKRDVGQSKWASLQATEKIFKSVIDRHKISFPKIHNLQKLSKIVNSIGFPSISDDLLKTIQCKPDTRYGNHNYNINDAIKAHHYSMYLSKELLKFCVQSTH